MIKRLLSLWRRNKVKADSSEARVLNNEFLKESYFSIYNLMQKDLDLDSRIIEIGGAGGIAKEFNSKIVVTDIRKSESVDMIVHGEKLPFENNSIDSIWAKDSIHHMISPQLFFQESHRVLKPGGKLSICEPYWSPVGKFIYKYLHPEIWSVRDVLEGRFTSDGNQALAYCIFKVKPENYDYVYQNFQVQEKFIVNGLSWMLSGGATLTTKVPVKLLKIISKYESDKKRWLSFLGLNIVINLKRIE